MLFILFLINNIHQVESSCCTQDKGVYKMFNSLNNGAFQCYNGMKFIGSIPFYCTFDNVPQIIIATLSYQYDKDAKFQFKILTTTTKEWTFSLQCFDLLAKVQKYEFSWIATDDNRLYVINDYLDSHILVTGFVSQSHTHPNSNGNLVAKATIVSYFGGDAEVDILQTIDGASFSIWKGTSGLGIQIIIGWAECLQLLETQLLVYVNRANVQIAVIPNSNYSPIVYQNIWFIQAFDSEVESQYRQLDIEQIPQIDGSIKIFAQWASSGSSYFYYMSYFVNVGQRYEPLYFKKMRTSKKICIDYKEYDIIWRLYVSELNKNYTQTQSITFDGNFQTLTLIYKYQCRPGQKVTGSILRCKDCQQKYQNFTQYCVRGINLLTIYINMSQLIDVYSQFEIELNNPGFSVYQTIQQSSVCLEFTKYQLIGLEVQNT